MRHGWSVAAFVGVLAGPVAGTAAGSTVDGSCMERWALTDLQPLSSRYQQVVESSSYRTRATVAMLLSSS